MKRDSSQIKRLRGTTDIHNDIDEFQKHYGKEKNMDTKNIYSM